MSQSIFRSFHKSVRRCVICNKIYVLQQKTSKLSRLLTVQGNGQQNTGLPQNAGLLQTTPELLLRIPDLEKNRLFEEMLQSSLFNLV